MATAAPVPVPVDLHSPSSDHTAMLTTPHDKHTDNSTHQHASQVHTPPTTDEASHKDDDAASTSSLSDLGDVEIDPDIHMRMDIDMDEENNRQRFEDAARAGAEAEKFTEVKPDRYENGVPIFTPTMEQFKDFQRYVKGVDPYGMQSGIVLIDPPEEWKQARKALDELVKTIKIKNPITQEFHGAQGIYTQRNMEKMRSYNLPQWKAICEQTENQPPAKRGEKRLNADKLLGRGSGRNRRSETTPAAEASKKRSARPSRVKKDEGAVDNDASLMAPPTPSSPEFRSATPIKIEEGEQEENLDPTPSRSKKGKKSAPRSRARSTKPTVKRESGAKGSETTVAARRLRNTGAAADEIDEEAFVDFDYRVYDNEQFTGERCEELEDKYWKSLNFSNPMYAADMPGSLFDADTTAWNVAKLPNLLDLLGAPIPGVNTAYLYLGMWRATFAWHLEDVDLYSINYIHFGAPKQWYSISQKDAPKFEAAMKSIWSQDAKNCDQFLRHKTYLVSPSLLKSKYGVQVNKVVHREGQFVITFPIGYHSGYNLGYNCAESVNFAIENWLNYGKTARKCQCEADSVFIDVDWFVRKMNGEPSPEYEEVEVTDDEDDYDDVVDLPTPPGSESGKAKAPQKRKRTAKDLGPNKKAKKIVKVRKASKNQPCCLCPNDFTYEELLPTSHGQHAHRTCAMYTPETYIATQDGKEKVFNVENISKARLDLRCHECKQKKGSCFQCSSAKCTRAYHATCAMQAGVQVDKGEIAVWHEGIEYRDVGFDWRCKLHRSVKRTRVTSELSACNHASNWVGRAEFLEYLTQVQPGELIQWQATQTDEIEAGVVISGYDDGLNAVLVSVLPDLHLIKEVEPASILFVDSSTSCLQKPSANALALPEELQGKTASLPDSSERKPSEGDPFTEEPKTEWAEFVSAKPPTNKSQKPVDFSKDKQLWLYLGEISTDSKARFTSDPTLTVHDPASDFLNTVKPAKMPSLAMAPPPQPRRQSLAATYPLMNMNTKMATKSLTQQQPPTAQQAQPFGPQGSLGQSHDAFMAVAKDKMMEIPRGGGHNAKPSQYHDIVTAAEARANEQARILQRQQAKAQQLDLQDFQYPAQTSSIGIDQQSAARQKQFQQQASQQSRNMSPHNAHQFSMSTTSFRPYHDNSPNYQNPDSAFKYGGFAMPQLGRAQQFQYSHDWMSPQYPNHAPSLSPFQHLAMPEMKSNSPQLSHSPMISGNSFMPTSQPSTSQYPSSHPSSQSAPPTKTFPSPLNSHDNSPRPSDAARLETIRMAASQGPPPRTPTEIERRRRISNPAYPFKSPEQLAAQKEERDKTGSQSSGSRPSSRPCSRPGSGYATAALPSPGLSAVTFGPDPQNPPLFINPNATQISPPGTSAGHRSKSGSISGAIGPMGPPAQPIVNFRRSMSSGSMIAPNMSTMLSMSMLGSSNQALPNLSQAFSLSSMKSLTALKSRVQVPDAPIAEPAPELAESLQPRPTHPDGRPKNDKPLPLAFREWKGNNGFWGRVADYFIRKREKSATIYKSPFGHGSAVTLIGPSRSGDDGLAGRYYDRLDEDGKRKVDDYRNERARSA